MVDEHLKGELSERIAYKSRRWNNRSYDNDNMANPPLSIYLDSAIFTVTPP